MAEFMVRLGHSTPQAAPGYQHVAEDADQVIAERTSRMAET